MDPTFDVNVFERLVYLWASNVTVEVGVSGRQVPGVLDRDDEVVLVLSCPLRLGGLRGRDGQLVRESCRVCWVLNSVWRGVSDYGKL